MSRTDDATKDINECGNDAGIPQSSRIFGAPQRQVNISPPQQRQWVTATAITCGTSTVDIDLCTSRVHCAHHFKGSFRGVSR